MRCNSRIHWYDDHRWVQRLRSCYAASPNRNSPIYSFPIEEILYQLFLTAKLDYLEDSLAYLNILWERYHNDHPDFNVTIDALIEDGWIDSLCGRWSLVGRCRTGYLDGVIDVHLRGILEFLQWLPTQINEYCSPIYLEDCEQELSRLRKLYPTLPEINWFIKEQILHTDAKHFCHIGYGPRSGIFFTALARLWLVAETVEQKAKWVEFAHQMGATTRLLNYLPLESVPEIVGLLAERFLDGHIPNALIESQRIHKSYMFECGRFEMVVGGDILRKDDCIKNLTAIEHRDWETFTLEWHRNALRYFELSAVIDHMSQVPADLLEPVLNRIQQLHAIGFLSTVRPIEPESIIHLLQYPQTQFAALHALIVLHGGQGDTGNQAAGDCLLAWLAFALRQNGFKNPGPIAFTLLYLSEHAYRGTKESGPESNLLQAVLQLLGRRQIQRSEFMRDLSVQLVEKLDSSKGITWCRRFQLLSQTAEEFIQAVPQESGMDTLPIPILLDALRRNLKQLLCTPFVDHANYIPSHLFESGFWPKLYAASDCADRMWMRNPILAWYQDTKPDTQQQFNARHQFQLGLTWLTALAKTFPEDAIIHRAFAQLLCFVLDPHNKLLTIEWIRATGGACPELVGAIGLLKSHGMSGLLEQLRAVRSSELILLIQYATDESVREMFLDELKQRIKDGQNDALEQIGWDQLIPYILEQKIELLYDTCEQHLEAYLVRVRGKKVRYDSYAWGESEHRMLSYIWLLRGNYTRLFKEGHPYMQAVARLEEGPYQNLDEATRCWKKLSEHSQDPSVYQNLLLSYLRKLEKQPLSNAWSEGIRHIEALRLKVEGELLYTWPKESQMQYADELVYYYCLTGDNETQALQKAASAAHISEDILAKRMESEEVSLTPQPQVFSPQHMDQLVLALQQFHAMPLPQKSRCFFESRSQIAPSQAGLALVLWEIFRTTYHLCAFGDKLLAGNKLYEDRCTQLFRELFNLNCGEWWRITANDQQQMGSTGELLSDGIHSSAEIDLLIQEDGFILLIDEALVLTNLDKGKLKEHLDKLIGNNIQNAPMVLMIYGNSTQTVNTWRKIKNYLETEYVLEAKAQKLQVEPFHHFTDSPFYFPEEYYKIGPLAEQALVTYVSHTGGKKQPLFILFADVGKRSHFEMSTHARKRKKGKDPVSTKPSL